MRSRWQVRTVVSWVALGSVLGCSGELTGFTGQVSVRRFFAGVYAVMPAGAPSTALAKDGLLAAAAAPGDPVIVNAVVRDGAYPKLSTAPLATVLLESSIITGLPAKLRVQADAPFTRIVLTVPGSIDYWELQLPAPVTDIQVVPTGSSSIPNTTFTMETAVGGPGGYGKGEVSNVHAVDLANSDVAVILRWNAYSDVDLHVTDPKGIEVYFGRTSSPEGGRLDLDSNPACNIDGVNQEVITWPSNQAPPGEYKVQVYYWSDCGVARSDFSVTFMARGRTLQVVDGSFTGLGSPNRGQEVARLTFP